jgi:hypothetical protein
LATLAPSSSSLSMTMTSVSAPLFAPAPAAEEIIGALGSAEADAADAAAATLPAAEALSA